MITVIKETPITAFGRDCMEQLVFDDDLLVYEACDLCAYRDWDDYEECGAPCRIVHGCGASPNQYFLLSQL